MQNENEHQPENPKRPMMSYVREYSYLVYDLAESILAVMLAGFGLCLAALLATTIAKIRSPSMFHNHVEALAVYSWGTGVILVCFWGLILWAMFKRKSIISENPAHYLASIAAGLILAGVFFMFKGHADERAAFVSAETEQLLSRPVLSQHPELSGEDAKVIAVAQAIKNILLTPGRPPCSPIPTPEVIK